MTKNSVRHASYLRKYISYDCHLWCKCVKWWIICFLFAHFNSFFSNYLFFKFINKCQKEILRCVPPSSHMRDFCYIFTVTVLKFHYVKYHFHKMLWSNAFSPVDFAFDFRNSLSLHLKKISHSGNWHFWEPYLSCNSYEEEFIV